MVSLKDIFLLSLVEDCLDLADMLWLFLYCKLIETLFVTAFTLAGVTDGENVFLISEFSLELKYEWFWLDEGLIDCLVPLMIFWTTSSISSSPDLIIATTSCL